MTDRWFATVDLEDASPAGRRAVDLVNNLLDHLMPTHLDRTRSEIGGDRGETFISLAHVQGKAGDLYIAVYDTGWTNLYGPHGHEEVYGSDFDSNEWAVDLNESVNEILTGHYQVQFGGWRSPRIAIDYGCTGR